MLQMSMFSRLLIGVVSLTMAVTPRGAMADIRIADPEVRPVEPYRGLAYSAEDIAEVRRLARQGIHPELVEQVFTESATWMAMSDEQIIDLVPDADAAFAYGFAGDPKTDQAWARHGRGGICSLDRPGTVRSPHTGDIYGNEQPGEEYYDPGDGWVRPSDGKRFYFKGIWNGYIVREFHHAVNCLAVNYLLTGDPAIAERALLILDQMATLRSARPEDDGPIDYVVAPRPGKGYFSVTGNQANEHTVYVALAFDLLAKAPYAAEPSSYDPDVTVFDNIRQNFFDVYEMWYMETKVSISNHPLMVLANMTAQGVLFGRDDYLRPAIEGTYAFLDGTINRDGDYYEHSTYGHLGRDYGAVMTMLLSRYDPARYDDPDAMPDPSDYPHELNFGNDPRWFAYCSDMLFRLPVAGHDPQYGDIGANRNILLDETRYWLARRRETSLRMLSGIVTRPDWKRHVEQLYAAIPPQDRAEPTLKHVLLYGLSQWRQAPAHDPAESGALRRGGAVRSSNAQ